jgi:hypothetical protein
MISQILHILLLSVILLVVSRRISKVDDRVIFIIFILLKISFGILIGFLYYYYYGESGDTIHFYEQSQALFQFFQSGRISFSEWLGIAPLSLSNVEFSTQSEPRTFFFVRLVSFIYAFTQGSYFIISIYLSFFAGLATWAFTYELVKISKENRFAIYLALLFIPSISFWSSGLLKESLMTLAIYSLGFAIIKWVKKPQKYLYAIPTILSIYVLWKIKYYVPITLLPILILTIFFYRKNFLKQLDFSRKLLIYFTMVLIGGVAVAFIHPVFNSGRFFELIRISHNVIADNSADAIIHFQQSESDLMFFIKNLPLAWFTGIFRPFFWEYFSVFSLLWAVEKLIFSILAIASVVFAFKIRISPVEKWWGIAALIYASVLASVITIATPNFGTLIRYEVAYMPFLWLIVLLILNKYKHNLK